MNSRSIAALGILLSAAVAFAQSPRVTVDVASARMRYADTVDATAFSLAPVLTLRSARADLSASGMLSRLSAATTTSGSLEASLFPAGRGRIRPELDFRAGSSHHSDGARTGELLASARLHSAAAGRGVWLGGGVGRTWDGDWRQILRGDAGGWLSLRGGVLAAVANPTSVDDTIRYLDAVLSFDRETARLDIGASLGARAGDRIPILPANHKTWGGVAAAYWVTPGTAVVASAGSYPVDFTQGYPGGRYVSVGIRFALRRIALLSLPAPRQAASEAVRRFEWRAVGDSIEFRVHAPAALKVEISGDFTTWEPVDLQHSGGGWWVGRLRVLPGTHQMNLRLDGGPWLVPPGLTPITDEFGVASGLLVLER
ncbi:MAG TPA: glycogen-binding domain-containing protein [Gemmatimonadaceae bacterium]|nr:glycogen-binding domain-containing protein [Gemmatimonadaceae bacterium]